MHDRCLQKLLFRFMILLQIQPLSLLLPLPYFFFFFYKIFARETGSCISRSFSNVYLHPEVKSPGLGWDPVDDVRT